MGNRILIILFIFVISVINLYSQDNNVYSESSDLLISINDFAIYNNLIWIIGETKSDSNFNKNHCGVFSYDLNFKNIEYYDFIKKQSTELLKNKIDVFTNDLSNNSYVKILSSRNKLFIISVQNNLVISISDAKVDYIYFHFEQIDQNDQSKYIFEVDENNNLYIIYFSGEEICANKIQENENIKVNLPNNILDQPNNYYNGVYFLNDKLYALKNKELIEIYNSKNQDLEMKINIEKANYKFFSDSLSNVYFLNDKGTLYILNADNSCLKYEFNIQFKYFDFLFRNQIVYVSDINGFYVLNIGNNKVEKIKSNYFHITNSYLNNLKFLNNWIVGYFSIVGQNMKLFTKAILYCFPTGYENNNY